jgi:sugar phosphate isomerase/epimerase
VEPWPIGVFASIDAGLGVKLDVARELGVPTIQLHAPAPATRTPERAREFLDRLQAANIRLTAVFGGFDGESYADIPTVVRTVGLVPRETRAARTKEIIEIADFARLLGCDVVALHLGSGRRCTWRRGRNRPTRCSDLSVTWSAPTCSSTSTRRI